MEDILVGYEVNKETWFYHSLLLSIALFFRFRRVWSLRNLDLTLLLLMAPGLVIVRNGTHAAVGYLWLAIGTSLLLIRTLFDGFFSRRPRLEQNLNTAGLAFLCVATMAFLGANAWNEEPPAASQQAVQRGEDLLNRKDTQVNQSDVEPEGGPSTSLAASTALTISSAVAPGNSRLDAADMAARILAILSHLGVVLGLICLSRWHFGEMHIGLAMATIYLLLPCTAFDVHKVNHVLPAALILWGIVAYRRPPLSGALLGLACGTLSYPVFLVPLWMSFYGRHGAWRFLGSFLLTATVLLLTVLRYSADPESFIQKTLGSLDIAALSFGSWTPLGTPLKYSGIWSESNASFRIPVFSIYLLMVIGLALGRRKKTLEQLIASSTAIILGTQFWYPREGGTYMLWYVPLLLVMIFRPRLSHLVAPWRGMNAVKTQPNPPTNPRTAAATTSTVGRELFR